MAQAINLQDTGQRTVGGSTEFNQVNAGAAFTIDASLITFKQGLETDNSAESGHISSAGFANPEVGTASTSGPGLALRGSLNINTAGAAAKIRLLAQLARTRGLIKLYSEDTGLLLSNLTYSSTNANDFAAEVVVSVTNPLFVRVGNVSLTQNPSAPFRITYNLNLLIHAE